MKCLYCGAAGVVWALDALRRRGHAETQLDLADAAARTLAAWREVPDFPADVALPAERQSSLLSGESGILVVAWRLAPSAALADDLFARVRENVHNEANELMWGSPGTMLVAQAMADWTGEQRWVDAWNESAAALRAARDADGFWTQTLYGTTARYLGPAHGLVGNALALREPDDATAAVLARTAIREDGLANWPPRDGARGDEIRVQWCHGAPGIIASAADSLDEELLLAGAELTWRAGPFGRGERPRALSRHRGKRLCVPEGVRTHRRRAVARPRAAVRRARARPGEAARSRSLLALDRRHRRRALRRRLHRRP